jgi:hypothetical protein
MTIHLISVGKSILDFLSDPYGSAGIEDMLADRISDAGAATAVIGATPEETANRIADCLTGTDPVLAGELAGLVRRIGLGRWPPGVSAELGTFAAAGHIRTGLPPGDVAVLLTSDTSAGLAAALWNALALTGADPAAPGRDGTGLDRVRYLPDLTPVQGPADLTPIFGSLRGPGASGLAVICRVPGLDAADSAGFRDAMGYLGWLGKGLLDHVQRPGEEFRFYLSGGFKATIPYLTGLAEGVRGLAKAQVTAWVLHETTDTAIGLPLRKLAGDVVRSQLGYFNGLVSDREPKGLQLDGYAYERSDDGRRWELTAFGVGLRNLFGLPAETP